MTRRTSVCASAVVYFVGFGRTYKAVFFTVPVTLLSVASSAFITVVTRALRALVAVIHIAALRTRPALVCFGDIVLVCRAGSFAVTATTICSADMSKVSTIAC